ncbi:MAG: VWA domain-containing protein [Chloroflexi bacterium]|nr:VWA domain-containing protein [Chloroflexota bacterium]
MADATPRRFADEAANATPAFKELFAAWKVFDLLHVTLDQAPADWLIIFNIARKLLGGQTISGIEMPKELEDLIQGNTQTEYERRTVTEVTLKESILPSENIDIRMIKNLTEVIRILPGQWLFKSVAEPLFWLKALNGSLLIAQPQEPQTVIEELTGTREIIVPVIKKQTPPRQKVYVLLDTSKSMEDAGKLTFGKALIFAYLLRASEERAEISFRHFRTVPFALIECHTSADFPKLAEHVLNLKADSSTNIGLAMKTAVDDIDTNRHLTRVRKGFASTPAAEILLISDCASYTGLPRIPSGIKLHTVHLEGGDEQSATPLDYESLVAEIRERSETFVRINTSFMVTAPDEDDATVVHDEILAIEDAILAAETEQAREDAKLNERIGALKKVAGVYKRMYQEGNRNGKPSQHLLNGELADNLSSLMTWEGVKESMRRMVEQARQAKSTVADNLRRLNPGQGRRGGVPRFRIKD